MFSRRDPQPSKPTTENRDVRPQAQPVPEPSSGRCTYTRACRNYGSTGCWQHQLLLRRPPRPFNRM